MRVWRWQLVLLAIGDFISLAGERIMTMLPPEVQRELLNFAEFLRQKEVSANSTTRIALLTLRGDLEDSATFAGSPLEIQERMRREWD